MKKILFLAPELPYPPHSGGKLKSWKLLQFLTEHYEVSVASILKESDSLQVQSFLQRAQIKDFYFDSVRVSRSLINLIKSYIKGIPLNVYRTHSDYFARQIKQNIYDYDMVITDHYEVFQYIPSDYPGKIVLHQHNAYYLMWERYAQSNRNPMLHRIASFFEAQRVKNYERMACQHSHLVFASPNDIDSLEKIGVNRHNCRYTYHLGDDSQVHLPSLQFKKTSETLLYVGSLNWEANIDGLLWFFKQVWPQLKHKRPNLKFTIIGKNPNPKLVEAAKAWVDIEFIGYIEDLEPYMQTSRIFVAPLLYGAGMKVKVLNAMSRGIPTVTTSIGSEGLAVENLKHLAIVDDAKVMQETIERLLIDEKLWHTLCQQSRHLVMEKYTWKQLLTHMQREIEHVLIQPMTESKV